MSAAAPEAFASNVRSVIARLDLPHPGQGRTAERWRGLWEIARADVSVARVVEAHVDALAILDEAGAEPATGVVYGVWAAEERGRSLALSGDRVHGEKPFCTGVGIVDFALVTARSGDGVVLAEVDVRQKSITVADDEWRTPAFADTCTVTASFDTPVVRRLGRPGWYLDRVGFWHGACGPAACWAGGVAGLVDAAVEAARSKPPEPHLDAHIGAMVAISWELRAVFDRAGTEIDSDPNDRRAAMRRARIVRHLVDRSASEAIDRFGRALGPRPLIRDHDVTRRISEIQVYVRQCHAERDLDALGRGERGLTEQ